jgi:hypothetical protein
VESCVTLSMTKSFHRHHAQIFAMHSLLKTMTHKLEAIRPGPADRYGGAISTDFRHRPIVFPLRISPRNWKSFSPSYRCSERSKTGSIWCGERSPNMLKPSPFDPGIPPMPKGLDGYARREWRRLVSHLSEKGVLCPADVFILQVTCQAYSELIRLSSAVKRSSLVTHTADGNANT